MRAAIGWLMMALVPFLDLLCSFIDPAIRFAGVEDYPFLM